LPSWAGSLRLAGVRAFDKTWNVHLEDAAVRVEEA
jgi:small nuclear ribonucleoprotein (snRNP)-like protein